MCRKAQLTLSSTKANSLRMPQGEDTGYRTIAGSARENLCVHACSTPSERPKTSSAQLRAAVFSVFSTARRDNHGTLPI